MNIVGKNLVLRALDSDDLERLYRWSNDPDVQQGLGGWHFPLSRGSLQKWIDSFAYDSRDQRFVIETESDGGIGLVTLTNINWKDRNAFHGILIGEKNARRKGHALNATKAIMRYAFEELNLARLDTTIVEFNTASLHLHVDRCGWKEEGRKANAVYRNGRYWSVVVLGITRAEYEAGAK